MNGVDLIALAGFLHDIGKFGQRAEIPLREPFKRNIYGHKHSAYTHQILQDYFNDLEGYHQASYEHHVVNENSDKDSWIVAVADRMASGFEREKFEEYNQKDEFENFKKQRLRGLFDESKEYKIAPLSPETIFYEENKSIENEYKSAWNEFKQDLDTLSKTKGSSQTDFISLDYLLKKHTTFMPSSTTFKIEGYDPVKANIPLYDHLKTTAIFAGTIALLDDKKRENIINYYRKTKPYEETNEFLLINGDFFGIQQFIFNEVEAKAASKVLRGKSAFVQILTKVIAFWVVEKLGLSKLSIITDSAGKFEILAPNSDDNKKKLKELQKELNKYFVFEFFGETGVGISFVECGLFDFIKDERYRDRVRKELALEVEKTKLNKFDLTNSSYEIEWDKDLKNSNQCFACKKRIGIDRNSIDKKVCDSCYRFIEIGKNLAKQKYLIFTKDKTSISIFEDYYIKFIDSDPKAFQNTIAIYDISKDSSFEGFAKWELSSYVATKNDEILTFEELTKFSVLDGVVEGKRERGVEALMALKGDVDNMGKFINESDITASFAKYNFFSRMVDYYFSVYVPNLMKKKYPNSYTIFAGGDDLFILGAWDETIGLAKDVRDRFLDFVNGSPLTFSVGMIMTKSNKPVTFIANMAEKALEDAKDMDGKDAISLFSETVKWGDYLDDLGLNEELSKIDDLNTTFLYRLFEFCGMSKAVKQGDIKATIWKSKFAYIMHRNMQSISRELFNTLDEMIEKYPKETKMLLSEFIYKRRSK